MLLDLKFSIGTLGIGSGAMFAGLFGMNLRNFMEESDVGFAGVTGCSVALAVACCLWGLRKLRKVQRVSMWGGGEHGQRSGIGCRNDVDPLPPILPGESRQERVKRMKIGNGGSRVEAAQSRSQSRQ